MTVTKHMTGRVEALITDAGRPEYLNKVVVLRSVEGTIEETHEHMKTSLVSFNIACQMQIRFPEDVTNITIYLVLDNNVFLQGKQIKDRYKLGDYVEKYDDRSGDRTFEVCEYMHLSIPLFPEIIDYDQLNPSAEEIYEYLLNLQREGIENKQVDINAPNDKKPETFISDLEKTALKYPDGKPDIPPQKINESLARNSAASTVKNPAASVIMDHQEL